MLKFALRRVFFQIGEPSSLHSISCFDSLKADCLRSFHEDCEEPVVIDKCPKLVKGSNMSNAIDYKVFVLRSQTRFDYTPTESIEIGFDEICAEFLQSHASRPDSSFCGYFSDDRPKALPTRPNKRREMF